MEPPARRRDLAGSPARRRRRRRRERGAGGLRLALAAAALTLVAGGAKSALSPGAFTATAPASFATTSASGAPASCACASFDTASFAIASFRTLSFARPSFASASTTTASAQTADDRAVARAYGEVAELLAAGRGRAARELCETTLARHPTAPTYGPFLRVAAADLARSAGAWDAALAHLDAALAGCTEASYHQKLACSIHGVRGQVYLDRGLFDLAAEHLARERTCLDALEAASPAEDLATERGNAALHAANLALAREEYDELERVVAEALAEDELGGAPTRAKLALRRVQGRTERAGRSAEAAREGSAELARLLAEGHLPWEERLKARVWSVELALRAGELDAASEHLAAARAATATDETAPDATDDSAPDGSASNASDRTATDAPDGSATDAPDRAALDAPDRAALASLAARLALARGDGAAELGARLAALEEAWADYLAQWSATTPRRGGFGFLQFTFQRELLSDLVHLALAVHGPAEGARRGLEALFAARAIGSFARRADGPPATLETARALVAPDAVLLVYLPGPTRSHLFVVDADGVEHVPLASTQTLEPLREELVLRVSRPARALPFAERERRDRRLAESATALAAELLPERARAALARWHDVTVTGLDLLGELPFELLPFEGAPLGEARAVTWLPSVPIGLVLDRRAPATPADPATAELLLVAAPEHGAWVAERFPHLAPIPLGATEAAALAAPYAARRTWTGPDASRARLARAALSDTDVLHVVAHGVALPGELLPPGEDRSTALVLAGETPARALFTCGDADALAAPPVVVLAACGTARGPVRRGDAGASDLGGALLEAGAQVVLLSPFALDHPATLALTTRFHAELVAGATPAEALRVARATVARDARWRDPHFTALLRVVGLGHRPVFASARGPNADGPSGSSARAVPLALLGGGIVVVALAALALARRHR